jgi:lipoprotein-anchoring transpeptidase ErfK/SrfK
MLRYVFPPLAAIVPLLGGCAHRPIEPAAEMMNSQASAQIEQVSQASVTPDPELLRPRPQSKLIHPEKDPRYGLPPAQSRALTIFLGSQTFEYVEDDRVVASGSISSGSAEHPTPTGSFHVLSKQKDKRSGKYTNYFDQNTPMPYSLQFYGPYFIHEGWLPGYADSHGCVRLQYEDARLLFSRIQVGDPVHVVAQGEAQDQKPWGDQYLVF